MSKTKLKTELDQYTLTYLEYTREELKRLQYWFDGFAAAGGKLPKCVQTIDTLHKMNRILHSVIDIKKSFDKID